MREDSSRRQFIDDSRTNNSDVEIILLFNFLAVQFNIISFRNFLIDMVHFFRRIK